jgi:hypothetical protein
MFAEHLPQEKECRQCQEGINGRIHWIIARLVPNGFDEIVIDKGREVHGLF